MILDKILKDHRILQAYGDSFLYQAMVAVNVFPLIAVA